MKTKLIELIKEQERHVYNAIIYRFTPEELQALMDKAFEEQRKKCYEDFDDVLMAKFQIENASQPETGIELQQNQK